MIILRRVASAVIGSILSGAYWIALFYFEYAVTYGDDRPDADPTIWRQTVPWVIWTAGILLHATLAWLCRHLTFAWLKPAA